MLDRARGGNAGVRRGTRWRPRAGRVLAAWALGALAGCGSGRDAGAPPEPTFDGLTLRVGVVAEPGTDEAIQLLVPLNAQRGEWEANRSGKLEVLSAPIPPDVAANARVDVLVFPGDLLGGLVDVDALATIPDETLLPPRAPEPAEGEESVEPVDDPFAANDILPAYRDRVILHGSERKALPLGASGLVLAFRRDVFGREELQAEAASAGIALEPPETYEQLDALAAFLDGRDWDGDGAPEAGIALALAGGDREGLAVATYLARAAALGLHPDYFAFLFNDDTMEPEIATPPFVAALDGLAALAGSGPEGVADFDAEAARAAFRTGAAALLIDRAEMAGRWTDPESPIEIGVAPLPGSAQVYDPVRKAYQDTDRPNRPSYLPHGGGWLAGLSSQAEGRQREAAIDFLRYLAGPETTARLLVQREAPMLPTRTGQLGVGLPDPRSAPGVDGRGWARAVAGTLTADRVMPGLRIPEADGYLDDLHALAIAPAIAGRTPAGSALEAAARAWADRTERLGTARQLWHFRRAIGRQSAADRSGPPPKPAADRPAG